MTAGTAIARAVITTLVFVLGQLVGSAIGVGVIMLAMGGDGFGFSDTIPALDDPAFIALIAGAEAGSLLATALAVRMWRPIGVFTSLWAVACGVASSRHAASIWMLAPILVVAALGPLAMEGDTSFDASIVIAAVCASLLIAIAEEVAFRGVVLSMLGEAMRPLVAVLVSAVLFGALHIVSASGKLDAATAVNAIGVTLLIAIPFGCVRIVSGSLVGPIVAHFCIDAAALSILGGLTLPEASTMEYATSIITGVVVAAAYLAWLRHCVASGRYVQQRAAAASGEAPVVA